MEQQIQTFIERMAIPPGKLGVKELRQREETWRALWSWIGDDVKYFVLRIGSLVRAIRRDYKGSLGELGEVKFEPKQFEIAVYEKRFNESDNKFYYERKVQIIPASAIMYFEFISEQDLASEVEEYALQAEDEDEPTAVEKGSLVV